MAKNNVQNVRFLRNGSLYATREEALNVLNSQNLAAEQDGSIILTRYGSGNTVKTLVGFVYVNGENKSLTIFDIEGASGDVENLRQEINAMDYTGLTADENKVVYNVTETNGIVAAEAKNISSVKLGGYAKSSSTGAIASTDTINEALSKLENKAAAITIANADKSINVTTGATGTDINVNIKSGERVLAKDGSAGVYTNIAISAATSEELSKLGTNVQEAYKLVATDGTKLGEFIKIYKDSSLVNLYLGHVDDLLNGTTAQTEESESSVVVPGSGSEALVWIVQLADGKYKLAAVDVESFLQESEFKDGLQVSNHEVSVKVDSTSEAVTTGKSVTANVLSVSSEGVKVGNIQAAIDYKVSTLNATVGSQTVASGNHVAVEVSEADGKLTAVTVTENNIASASDLTAEIAARKAVDGQDGQTYVANSGKKFISSATSLNGADVALNDALENVDSKYVSGVTVNGKAVTVSNHVAPISISAAAGTGAETKAIAVNTDNSTGAVTISLLGLDCGTY